MSMACPHEESILHNMDDAQLDSVRGYPLQTNFISHYPARPHSRPRNTFKIRGCRGLQNPARSGAPAG